MKNSNYESFVQHHPDGTLFQSGFFGAFQETLPYRGKSWKIISKNGLQVPPCGVKAGCLVVRQKLPLGFCWLWIPYGPLLDSYTDEYSHDDFNDIWKKIAGIAKKERAIFCRVEPSKQLSLVQAKYLAKEFNIYPSVRRYTPEHTLHINLDCDEDAILVQMKPKGRYNIGVAKKHGVVVLRYDHLKDIPPEDFDAFYAVLQKTGGRDTFGIHPKSFYENLLRTLGDAGLCSMFLAYNKDRQVVAGIIVTYYKDTATYYYGASDHTHRTLMAPYLLQWEAMQESRRRGMRNYDLLGVAPEDSPDHPWTGVTEFKKKFGGEFITYPRSFLVVYKTVIYKILTGLFRKRF